MDAVSAEGPVGHLASLRAIWTRQTVRETVSRGTMTSCAAFVVAKDFQSLPLPHSVLMTADYSCYPIGSLHVQIFDVVLLCNVILADDFHRKFITYGVSLIPR